jgi:hypothetical protein
MTKLLIFSVLTMLLRKNNNNLVTKTQARLFIVKMSKRACVFVLSICYDATKHYSISFIHFVISSRTSIEMVSSIWLYSLGPFIL